MSGSPYFVDVELIQIEKNRIILCYVLFDQKDVAKYGLKFCNRPAVSGQDFQNTPCPAVPYFKYFESICVQYPIHQVLPCPRSPRSC